MFLGRTVQNDIIQVVLQPVICRGARIFDENHGTAEDRLTLNHGSSILCQMTLPFGHCRQDLERRIVTEVCMRASRSIQARRDSNVAKMVDNSSQKGNTASLKGKGAAYVTDRIWLGRGIQLSAAYFRPYLNLD
jgi:hypothetical protein